MIAKKLCSLLNYNRRFVLQKLDSTFKYTARASSSSALPLTDENLSSKSLEDNYEEHIDNSSCTIKPFQSSFANQLAYAHAILTESKTNDYSGSLAKQLAVVDLTDDEIEKIMKKSWETMENDEFLRSFELMSHYAGKNEKLFDDPSYSHIFKILSSRCVNFSDDQIEYLLNCLILWPKVGILTQTYKDLFKIVDHECLKRLPNWTTTTLLKRNDQFFRLRCARKAEFTYHSLKKIGRKVLNLSAENLIHFTFLLKVNRRIAVNYYEIEYAVEQNCDQYSVEELGIFAGLFHKHHIPVRSRVLMLKMLKKLNLSIDDINEPPLVSILALLRLVYRDEEIRKELDFTLNSLIPQISHRSLITLITLMELQKRNLWHNKELTLTILEKYINLIENLKINGLQSTTHALLIFNYDPKETPFYKIAIDEVLGPRHTESIEKYPNTFVGIVSDVVQANYFPEEAVKRVLNPDFIGKYKNAHILTHHYLLLDYCIELEHPEYTGPRLQDDEKKVLLKKFGSVQPHIVRRCQKMFLSRNLLNEVVDVCKQVYSEKKVDVDSVLPHFPSSFVILCRDKETNEIIAPVEQLSKQAHTPGTCKYAPKDGNKWYALLMGSYKLMIRNNGMPGGMLRTEMRHLEILGYTPIVIPCQEWDHIDNDERQKYIKNVLV